MNKVFISHATEDKKFVEDEIIQTLKSNGIETWYSRNDINGATQWALEIRKGLEDSEWFFVILTPRLVKSKWVGHEVFWAMEHRQEYFVPVMLENCDPTELHFAIEQLNYVDYRRNRAEARAQLLKVCRSIASDVPVIALMGTKDGVGKTTITFCILHLPSAAGYEDEASSCYWVTGKLVHKVPPNLNSASRASLTADAQRAQSIHRASAVPSRPLRLCCKRGSHYRSTRLINLLFWLSIVSEVSQRQRRK